MDKAQLIAMRDEMVNQLGTLHSAWGFTGNSQRAELTANLRADLLRVIDDIECLIEARVP